VFAALPGAAPNAIRICLSAAATRGDLERGVAVIADLLAGSDDARGRRVF
jgi:hypothetical protein